MGRTPHESAQIEQRRQQVAEGYLEGRSQAALARELRVSQATVSSDLKAIRQQWKESGLHDFDEAVQEELQKLKVLEREAWEGWRRSQAPAESTRIVQADGIKRAEKTVRQQTGDPRFLDLVHRASSGRRALLGLDAPQRIAPTSPDGDEAYHAHVMRKLSQLAEGTESGPTVIDAEYIQRQLTIESDAPAMSAREQNSSLFSEKENHYEDVSET